MKITLRTVSGLVIHQADITPANGYPEVVIWGTRVFTICAPGEYRETGVHVLPAIAGSNEPKTELESAIAVV